MTPVLGRTLLRERRPIIGWAFGVGVIAAITLASWPAIGDSADDFSEIMDELPEAITAFFGDGIADFSAAGVVGSRLYGTIGLALFVSYAISRGARAVAGEEGDGTLEMLVVQPISRRAIAVDKAMAMLIGLAALVLLELLILVVAMPIVDLSFGAGKVAAATVGLYLLSAMFGSLAFAVGAATGRRGAAVGVAGGAAGGLFLLAGFGALVDALEPVADVSPFAVYDGSRVLAQGLGVVPVLAFAALTLLGIVVGVLAFDRRDLS